MKRIHKIAAVLLAAIVLSVGLIAPPKPIVPTWQERVQEHLKYSYNVMP